MTVLFQLNVSFIVTNLPNTSTKDHRFGHGSRIILPDPDPHYFLWKVIRIPASRLADITLYYLDLLN